MKTIARVTGLSAHVGNLQQPTAQQGRSGRGCRHGHSAAQGQCPAPAAEKQAVRSISWPRVRWRIARKVHRSTLARQMQIYPGRCAAVESHIDQLLTTCTAEWAQNRPEQVCRYVMYAHMAHWRAGRTQTTRRRVRRVNATPTPPSRERAQVAYCDDATRMRRSARQKAGAGALRRIRSTTRRGIVSYWRQHCHRQSAQKMKSIQPHASGKTYKSRSTFDAARSSTW